MCKCSRREANINNRFKKINSSYQQLRMTSWQKLIFSVILLSIGSVAADSAFTYDSYRLPRALHPEHYSLVVNTNLGDDDKGYNFNGNVKILMVCDEDATNVTLHLKNLTISEKEVVLNDLSKPDARIDIKNTEYIIDNDYVVFHLGEVLKKGSKYEIFIPFEQELSPGLLGYYKSSYFDKKSQQKIWLSVTQFEPTYARRAFPCFDEPEMKATFDISLGHHKKYTALSNMPVNKTEIKDNWVIDVFERTVPMSTYLVAYTVNDFEYKEAMTKMPGDVVFKIWARRDAIDQVDYARTVGPEVTKYYEDYFDIKFPLPKIDMIAIPDFSAGAMENWGLITYRETALLYHPNISSASSKHRVASVIAHELAHQWFGNLVTMKWWTDLWLNEGFATYVASLGVEHLHPEWNSLHEESVDNTLNIFKFDSLKSSHPVSVEIGNPNQISQIFDAISYDKGSTIIRMMHLFLGEESFRNGVSRYLKKHKYNNAEQSDLWAALTEEAHQNGILSAEISVKDIMSTWTLQTGYPVITVTRDYEGNSAEITQMRYLADTNRLKSSTDICWWVPLTYADGLGMDFNNTHPKDWLSCSTDGSISKQKLEDLPDKNVWVIFNTQLSGLYKIKYDKENYRMIIEHLNGPNFKNVNAINRAQLIDDAMDLAWTGDQEYGIAFAMINYLKQEDEYIPWKSALSNLNSVNRLLKRTPLYGVFRSYVQQILEPIYLKLGGLDVVQLQTKNDRLDAVKHKVMISAWSCRFSVGDCVEKSVKMFREYMQVENPEVENPVPLDLRSVVYCNAMRNGNEREWNFLWQRYLNSNVGSEKAMIIASLGCTREIWLLQRYLQWSLEATSGVRKQDITTLYAAVVKSDVGFHLAKSFLFENIDQIYDYLAPDTSRMARYIKPLAEQMATGKELEELKDLITRKPLVFEKSTQGVKQSYETIEINTQWKQTNYQKMARYLEIIDYKTFKWDDLKVF